MDYSKKIANQVAAIPRSGIRDFFELVQGRDDVISLGVGEPDFVTPWHIREAAIFSLERGHTSYTSNLGLPALRRAVAQYVGDFFEVDYDAMSEVLAARDSNKKRQERPWMHVAILMRCCLYKTNISGQNCALV